MELAGKVAVVSGASMGIGRACAEIFAENGADVAFTYGCHDDEAAETADRIRALGREVYYESSDAKDMSAIESFMAHVMEKFGRVDVLVNNVGGADTTPDTGFADMPFEYWVNQFNKNFFSAVRFSQLALRSMIPRRFGSIVNIGSVHTSRVINLDVMPYSCAKEAMNRLTKNLAVELAPHRIRCNVIAPGLIRTALTENRYDAAWWEAAYAKIPLHAAGEPRDIAELAWFLVSERSGYLTGQIIGVDGGRSL